jgi:uncharacterized protein YceK
MANTLFTILFATFFCGTTGCASMLSMGGDGTYRMRPYGGVRATVTDWEGCSDKPWGNDPYAWHVIPYKLYYRTIDLPLSLVMDTWCLPLTWNEPAAAPQ